MSIFKDNDELVLRIPLWQKSFDAVDTYIGDVPNLIGVIAGDELSISYLSDLGYKGDQQEGAPLIMFYDRESLQEACQKLGLDIWEHPLCGYCNKAIRGSFTFGKEGNMCPDCEYKGTKIIEKI